ncbi:MAG TPA: DUF6335 family protein [Coleofasciculaceae cyanobacterium]|jgi:hypothetical protein
MADRTQRAAQQPEMPDEGNLSDIPIEDTDLVSDIPVEDIGEPVISDLPQEITESYGTGVALEPGLEIGGRTMHDRMDQYTSTGPELTGGDVDARWDQAAMVGDEAVGGTVATPDQSIVEELGAAVGIDYDDREFLRTNDILEERDESRWELDPTSSEDYQERRD